MFYRIVVSILPQLVPFIAPYLTTDGPGRAAPELVVPVNSEQEALDEPAGDLVVFPEELSCTWHVTEAVTKHYNFG